MKNETQFQKTYFHTGNNWIDLNDSRHDTSVKMKFPKSLEITRPCTDYWDSIKQKYGYNHLYRKRVLKIKQEELEDRVENKNRIFKLLENEGKIQAMYLDRSGFRDVRGVGVNKLLNGEKAESPFGKYTEESILASAAETSSPREDILDQIMQCLKGKKSQERISVEVQEADSPTLIEESKCSHFKVHKHKQLFTDPDCCEVNGFDIKSGESISKLTDFEHCMRELWKVDNNTKKEPPTFDEQVGEDYGVEDPWCTIAKFQLESYGYADREVCNMKKTIAGEEAGPKIKNICEQIIENLMDKDIRMKGIKIKVKDIVASGQENIADCVKFISATLKGKDGEYLKGVDIRIENEIANEDEGEMMLQVLNTLVGEWRTIGIFLQQLAETFHSFSKNKTRKLSQEKILGSLGMNVIKLVSEIIEGKNEGESQDLSVEIKFNNLPCKGIRHLSLKSDESNVKTIYYREKLDYAVKGDGKKKIIQQTVTKKEFSYEVNKDKDLPENIYDAQSSSSIDQQDEETELISNTNKDCNNMKSYHRGLVELMTGSKYAGSWNQIGMEGCGLYISPGGIMTEGNMTDGVLHGPASIYLPNGIVIEGSFNNGKFHAPKITFGDGLEYKSKDWNYLKETKKLNKNEILRYIPFSDRIVPQGFYDAGEGFYNQETKIIYHPISMAPLRTVSAREDTWITSICRAATPKCVSLAEHLYEVKNITIDKEKKKEAAFSEDENVWADCRSPLYFQQTDEFNNSLSLDRLIEVNVKSKPVEEIWNNIRDITGSQKAKIGVPFSYEHAIQYTCQDEQKKN